MKEGIFTITDNTEVADQVFSMRLSGDTSEVTRPGQFINIKIEGFFLRRPISVSYADDKEIRILYKIVGDGTRKLSTLPVGIGLDIITGLGNGFNVEKAGSRPLILGGGIGSAPMHMLCDRLVAAGSNVTAVLGFASAKDVILAEEFKSYGDSVKLIIATMDGSLGIKGTIADALKEMDACQESLCQTGACRSGMDQSGKGQGDRCQTGAKQPSNGQEGAYSYYYVCGPMPMIKAVHSVVRGRGEYSLEERMGCGFGACMGCSIETADGPKRVCKDGPVFAEDELIWTE